MPSCCALPSSPIATSSLSDVRSLQALLALDAGRLDGAAPRVRRGASRSAAHRAIPDTADIDYLARRARRARGTVRRAGLDTMLEVARRARAAQQESTGVTAFRWTAAIGDRVMDLRRRRPSPRRGPALRGRDRAVVLPPRHGRDLGAPRLGGRRWDDAVRRPGRSSSNAAAGAARRARATRWGSSPSGGARSSARGRCSRTRSSIGMPSGEVELRPARDVGPRRDGARWRDARREPFAPVRGRARARRAHGGARAARSVRRDRCPCRARRPPPRRRRGVAGAAPRRARGLDVARPARPRPRRRPHPARAPAPRSRPARHSRRRSPAGWRVAGSGRRRGRAWISRRACSASNREAEASSRCGGPSASPTQLDSVPLADARRELLAMARSRGAEEEPWRPLTAREFEVARLIADGLTNADDRRGSSACRRGPWAPTSSTSSPSSASRVAPRSRPGSRRWPSGRRRSSAADATGPTKRPPVRWRSRPDRRRSADYSPNVLLLGLQDRSPGSARCREERAVSPWDLAPVLGVARDALDGVLQADRVTVVGEPLEVLLAREGAEGAALDVLSCRCR